MSGTYFDNNKMSQGLYVTKLHVCGGTSTDGWLDGIKMYYSDGSAHQQGHFQEGYKPNKKCQDLNIDVARGERITEIELRFSEDDKYLARLRIKTNHGDELFISKNYCHGWWLWKKCYYTKKYEWKGAELGEGIILGMKGKQQWHIRNLRFRLLQKVIDYKLTNVRITNLPEPQLVSLYSHEKPNPSKTDVTIGGTCKDWSEREKEGRSWTTSHQLLGGWEASVKYKSPKLASYVGGKGEGEVKAKFEYTFTWTTMETWEAEKAKTLTTCLIVPRLSKYKFDIRYYVSKGDADWTGTMRITTVDGVWSFDTSGKYHMVSTTGVKEDANMIAKYVNHEWVPCSKTSCLGPTPKPTMRPTGSWMTTHRFTVTRKLMSLHSN